MDYLSLKAELLVNGIDATPEALNEVGCKYKEQNHGLFGWDFEDHINIALPDDFVLPDGTIVQFRRNKSSGYKVKLLDDRLKLCYGEKDLCEIQWLPRPKFYNLKTSSGNKMVKIGQIGGEDCLFFCYQNYCSHFAKDEQCLFCNLVSTSTIYDSVLKRKSIEDIGEVAKEAFSEGQAKHVLLTGGCFSHEKEIQLVSEIVESISRHTGFSCVPGTILPSPPKTLEEIQKYHSSGIKAIGFSMEIWDKRLFQAICPGKSNSVSHESFVKSIRNAVKVFGEGNVYGVFVMGLEPSETFLQGVKGTRRFGR